jgi:PilZ domain-containing protein
MTGTPNSAIPQPTRAYARVPLHSPIEVKTRSRTAIGQIENISVGGLLVSCDLPPAIASEVMLLFNLAAGCTVSATAVVKHASKNRFGAQFHDIVPEARDAIAEFCQANAAQARRSGRIAKRLLVTVKGAAEDALDELGETLLLSRNGGLLACRAQFSVGERLQLYWPEKKRATEIEVVSFRPFANDLRELGFEFVREEYDFWQMEFPVPS